MYIGIDPGLTGAIAILGDNGQHFLVEDLPVIRDGKLAWIDGAQLQSIILSAIGSSTACAVVERVSSMPGQGIASAFTFGAGLGSVLGVLQAMHIPIELVGASMWKRAFGLSKDKSASLHRARLLYPTAPLHLAKHDDRAEALLLARYGLTRGERSPTVVVNFTLPQRDNP